MFYVYVDRRIYMSVARENTSQPTLTSPADQRSKVKPKVTTRADKHTHRQPIVFITTEDVLRCLENSNSSLTLDADEVWVKLVYTGISSGPPPLSMSSTCWLQVRGRREGIMSLLIFNMTSVPDNKVVVHSPMRNRQDYEYDPLAWMSPGVELAMTSNCADVGIQINDVHKPYSLHAQFKTVQKTGQKLEIREVTRYLGTSRSLCLSGWLSLSLSK